MKKVFMILIALMLMLCLSAQAQTLEFAYEGVTFTLPDDFVSTLDDDGDTVAIHMYTSESLDDALFIIGVCATDYHSSTDIEADLMVCYEEIADDLHEASHEIKAIGDYTFLIISEATTSEIIYLTQAHGNMIQVTCIASGEAGLTQSQSDAILAIVTSMQVAPSPEE